MASTPPELDEASDVARREARWRSPLGQRVRDERNVLEALTMTGAPEVRVGVEHLRYIGELLADVLEGIG